MRVLITGGAGFIGLHLARWLGGQGYEIVLLDNLQRAQVDEDLQDLISEENVNLIRGDITRQQTFDELDGQFDYVYHLAAINGTKNFYQIPDQVLRVTAIGTLNLLDWFVNSQEGKVLFSSSSEVYASTRSVLGDAFPIPTPENVPLTVADPRNVRWSYGAGKLMGEVAMYSYAKSFGMHRFAIVRYHNIYGPRMGFDHVVPEFLRRIESREDPFKIYGGDQTRSFCYVDDAVRATQVVMEAGATDGQIVHIGRSDDEIPIADLARRAFDLTGFHPAVEWLEPPVGSVERRCPDTRLLEDLEFKPEVGLDEGLGRCLGWYEGRF